MNHFYYLLSRFLEVPNLIIAENCQNYIIADGYIFVIHAISQFDTKIIRYNLDGTGSEVLLENNDRYFLPLFTDNGYLYFLVGFQSLNIEELTGNQIQRIKFDGSGRQIIVQHPEYGSPENVIFNNGNIYYTYSGRVADSFQFVNQIFKINKEGGSRHGKRIIAGNQQGRT